MPSARLLLATLCLLVAGLPLRAQTVRGALVDEATGAPIAGVLVVLLDAAGAQQGGALTDGEGRFLLRAPAAGRYRLRAERIGHSAVTSPLLELAVGQTLDHRLSAPSAAVQLEGLVVQGRSRDCAVRPGQGVEAAALWEEARKALATAAWSQDQGIFQFRLLRYQRELELPGLRVRSETARSESGFSRNPLVSLPPQELAERGYVQARGGGTFYYAPDARALLSDVFLDGHCFRVEPGEGGLVGLAFTPVRRRGRPDVRGVLWLDARTAELRHLEYRYTGVTGADVAEEAGGRVEFERLPGGAWIVRRWWIRMPVVSVSYGGFRSVRGGQQIRQEVVRGLTEEGGEVVEIRTPGGALVRGSGRAGLAGEVFDSTRGRPLPGARVVLSGTSYAAATDSLGRFRLEELPEGRFELTFSHPRLDSLGFSPAPHVVQLERGSTRAVQLAVPPLPVVWAAACADSARREGTSALVGEVRNTASGTPLPGARVVVSRKDAPAEGNPAPRLEAVTDAEGRYRICAAPAGVALRVGAEFLGRRSGEADLRLAGGAPARYDLELAWYSTVGVAGATPLGASRQPVAVSGRLLDAATARPVAGAVVRIAGTTLERVTDQRGRFTFAEVPPAAHRIEVEHPRYGARSQPLAVGGGAMEVELQLSSPAPRPDAGSSLREVAVEGLEVTARPQSRYLRGTGFYDRQRMGVGTFLSPDDIRKRGRVLDAVSGIRGIYAIPRGKGIVFRNRRFGEDCWVAVYIDGILSAATQVERLRPEDIEGIEVYDGTETPGRFTPARRQGKVCGAVAIWTRNAS